MRTGDHHLSALPSRDLETRVFPSSTTCVQSCCPRRRWCTPWMTDSMHMPHPSTQCKAPFGETEVSQRIYYRYKPWVWNHGSCMKRMLVLRRSGPFPYPSALSSADKDVAEWGKFTADLAVDLRSPVGFSYKKLASNSMCIVHHSMLPVTSSSPRVPRVRGLILLLPDRCQKSVHGHRGWATMDRLVF